MLKVGSYLIICAHIQHDRQALLWWHASAGCVQGQLAHWDAHTMTTQVSKPQDPLSISHTHGLSTTWLSELNQAKHLKECVSAFFMKSSRVAIMV